MKTLLSVALTVCAMLGLSRSAAGDMIMIDDFSLAPQTIADGVDNSAPVVSEVGGIAPTSTIGGVRYIDVGLTSPSGGGVFNTVSPGSGVYSSPIPLAPPAPVAGSIGTFSYGYDGVLDLIGGPEFDPSDNPNPFNLNGMNELGITAFTQASSTFGLLATLYNGATAYSVPFIVTGNSSKEYRVSLDDLVSNTTIDLANITGIKISDDTFDLVNNPDGFIYAQGQSVTLTQIRTFQTPEPSSMILLTLTGMGFAGATWRRRRKLALAA